MQILTLPLTLIEVSNRLRGVDPKRAEELAVSLREVGQITPIEVMPADARGKHRLITGAHRVEATRIAGGTTIVAVVFGGEADAARLREIDENLYRHELTPFDQAAFLAERRAIYERVIGAVKVGRRKSGQKNQLTFYDEVFERFGLNREAVKRSVRRRARIADVAWARLAGTKIAESGVILDAIGALDMATQQQVVALLLTPSGPKTVAAALRQMGRAPVVGEGRKLMQALMSAWDKATPVEREQFMAFQARTALKSMSRAVDAERKRITAEKGGAA